MELPVATGGNISTENLALRILEISKHLQISYMDGYELVRVGGPADGGYIMLNNFEDIDGAISLGVGPDISWDLDISKKIPLVHLYDHSITKMPNSIPSGTWFKEKAVAHSDLSGTSLEEMISRIPESNRLLLKCDIEDSEWEIFSQCSKEILQKFDQIVVEFHWIIEKLNNDKFALLLATFENLAQTHSVINIHANNYAKFEIVANCPVPDVMEITYARTKSYKFEQKLRNLNLNASNSEENPEIQLIFPIPS
ncbi:unannotated protein [freshwater metagenome]|uniref:Unannotated protein n=1 Tax=freshwater metagenome TaxID=449393 RepID=A0A6J7HCI9_9ZZZZ|nr:hypothetical protein [Actinomycetota bacterium]